MFGGRLTLGLPAPRHLQVVFVILAIVLEIVMFITLMPLVRRRGERAVLVATLAIVGAHFLVMLPAFGSLVAVLGILCLLNAAIAWRKSFYRIEAAWILDGAMKVAAGILMPMTSPMFA